MTVDGKEQVGVPVVPGYVPVSTAFPTDPGPHRDARPLRVESKQQPHGQDDADSESQGCASYMIPSLPSLSCFYWVGPNHTRSYHLAGISVIGPDAALHLDSWQGQNVAG
jgi:hypothetical protein